MGLGVSLCVMSSMILCVCMNFLYCDFLDLCHPYTSLLLVSTSPHKMPIAFAPWMTMYIKIKVYTFTVYTDFIPSGHPLTWETNPITTQGNAYRIIFNFYLLFSSWVSFAARAFVFLWRARPAVSLWCAGSSLRRRRPCRARALGLLGFGSCGMRAPGL